MSFVLHCSDSEVDRYINNRDIVTITLYISTERNAVIARICTFDQRWEMILFHCVLGTEGTQILK